LAGLALQETDEVAEESFGVSRVGSEEDESGLCEG
jgi:hypothetical protein